MPKEATDELIYWRLVFNNVVSYGDLEHLSLIDAMKLNDLLDYKERQHQKELEKVKNSR